MVYVIQCTACHKSYVGCTSRKLKIRILERLNDIANPTNRNILKLARHFIEEHNGRTDNFLFHGIETVISLYRGGDLVKLLRDKEAYWILTLNSMIPGGFNFR